MRKILVLGSGALKIGEAGEFDYSGSQAIKALKEERIKTVLVNPNIATIQTSEFLADKIYFLPINEYFVEKIIKKEAPDGIFLSFGGQTALNCGVDLYKKGVLQKYKVKILGTPMEAIITTENRKKFADHIKKIGFPIPKSCAASTVDDAKKIVIEIGFPVMIRAAYSLGGQKSGVARNIIELEKIVSAALVFSPQVLIEKYLYHFKEIEYEVIRDKYDNCITVCNMENFDPLGIHTGESIVVAPSQTLTNFEYHYLRQVSIEIIKSLEIVGECNIQFALNPKPIKDNHLIDYYIIEINARLSRSSALASKATGYPLAYVAAKLALGKGLIELKNQVTQVTQSFFEPALDYVVVKIPRWDLEKFKGAEEEIGSCMKSVGEVMAIGRNFEEAIQKAVRMLDIGAEGVTENYFPQSTQIVLQYIKTPTPKRLFAIAEGLKRGIAINKIYDLTGIDPWFLYRIKNIVEAEKNLKKSLDYSSLLKLKQLGFSDKKINQLIGKKELEIRSLRKKLNILPSVFQIDTLAGEVPAKTNYLYTTYNGFHHDVEPLKKKGVMVLGSGPYRIGSSVEFDWTCVNTGLSLKKYKKKSIILNCNPETVSTDYDISERLYFEELSFERVTDIYEFEKSLGVIVSVGGQTPNNIVSKLNKFGINILGTKAKSINQAEDRSKFSRLLDKLNIDQPQWNKFTNLKQAIAFSQRVNYPVLIRPSYVLSGSAMNVCYDDRELEEFINKATIVNKEYPITVSKFIPAAKEIDFDAVAQNGKIKIFAISEHIENAGVHSGDATILYPPQRIYIHTERQIIKIAHQLASALEITGPFNIQFLAKDDKVFVIEINLRASRTFPFVSKATGKNFAEVIVDSFFSKAKTKFVKYPDYVVIKAPQFSFARLEGADPILQVEMASTGEVACFGKNIDEALLKAVYSAGNKVEKKAVLLSIGGVVNKRKFLESAECLKQANYKLYATKNTHSFLKVNGVDTSLVAKVHEEKKPNVADLITDKKVSLVINISEKGEEQETVYKKQATDGFLIRRAAVDNQIPLFTELHLARAFVKAICKYNNELEVKEWSEYV